MHQTRRAFLASTAATVAFGQQPPAPQALPIVDTHQHLWDRTRLNIPWLADASEILRQNYRTEEYREATRGLEVRAVYMEVDVEAGQKTAEVDYVVALGRERDNPMVGAVVGGVVAADGFADYVRRIAAHRPFVKGVRQVLHGSGTPAGFCLQGAFVRGVRLLGENNLSFDLCIRPTELADAVRLTEQCPDTRFILDHCGNADPKAFRRAEGTERPAHEEAPWRRDIDALARRTNLICKISGIVARAPRGWTAEDLAPIVNHCLDAFGPDRVVFGGDWPVCTLGASYAEWVNALKTIIATRSEAEQRKLLHDNTVRIYRLS